MKKRLGPIRFTSAEVKVPDRFTLRLWVFFPSYLARTKPALTVGLGLGLGLQLSDLSGRWRESEVLGLAAPAGNSQREKETEKDKGGGSERGRATGLTCSPMPVHGYLPGPHEC